MRCLSAKATRLGVLAAVVIGSLTAWSFSAALRGRLAARFDVSRGNYVLLVYGLPPPWQAEEVRLLHERYGIRMKAVAGCTVTQSLIRYADAYDDYVIGSGKKKFGIDVFKETAEEAERNWKAHTPAMDEPEWQRPL